MSIALIRPTDRDGLFVWLIHRFAEVFEDKAILKGGLVLRLLDSPRMTNDVDFVFAPYSSKKEIQPMVEKVLAELPDAEVGIRLHSKMLRATVHIDGVGAQIECSIARECASIPMTTASIAEQKGYAPHVIRIMAPGTALAHKLAAWNERRLLRDLYDAFFLLTRVGVTPDISVLEKRLLNIRSRQPALKNKSSMTLHEFKTILSQRLVEMTDDHIDEELAGLLSPAERTGLCLRIRAALTGWLQTLITDRN